MIDTIASVGVASAPIHLMSEPQLPAVAQPGPVTAQASQPLQLQSADTPTQLLAIAVQRGASIEELRELAQLAREMREDADRERKRQAELSFRRDFAAFRGENVIIPKTKRVDRGRAGSFDQAEFHEVASRLSPALSRHGFGFRHDQKFTSRKWVTDGAESDVPWVIVTCYLEHRDGYREELVLEGPPGETDANTPVQNMQVTASILKRQSLLAITGTATGGEDDEGRMLSPRGRQQTEDGPDAEFERLLAEGDKKAAEGLKALTAWWQSIGEAKRGKLMQKFGALKAAARRVDEGMAQ